MTTRLPMNEADLARFMAFVEQSDDGCWLWSGALKADGYGKFALNRPLLAHRVAYEHFVGPLRDGMHIDHLCFNRACVNPDHLEQVTPLENQRRAIARRSNHDDR
jgi:hypothetical protein